MIVVVVLVGIHVAECWTKREAVCSTTLRAGTSWKDGQSARKSGKFDDREELLAGNSRTMSQNFACFDGVGVVQVRFVRSFLQERLCFERFFLIFERSQSFTWLSDCSALHDTTTPKFGRKCNMIPHNQPDRKWFSQCMISILWMFN